MLQPCFNHVLPRFQQRHIIQQSAERRQALLGRHRTVSAREPQGSRGVCQRQRFCRFVPPNPSVSGNHHEFSILEPFHKAGISSSRIFGVAHESRFTSSFHCCRKWFSQLRKLLLEWTYTPKTARCANCYHAIKQTKISHSIGVMNMYCLSYHKLSKLHVFLFSIRRHLQKGHLLRYCVCVYIYIYFVMGCPDCPGVREAWKMPQPMVSESFDREVMRCP